jgi:O-antigen/teichoic acid export membrane protein
MADSLKNKTVKGVFWSLIEKFGIYFVRFVIEIFLARILAPKVFGLMGMIVVFFEISRVLIDSGFGNAYIQKNNATSKDANSIFYFNLLISIVIYGILYFSAPLIAEFYEQSKLIILVRVTGLVIIIHAFVLIQVADFKRALNFKDKSKITLLASLMSGISALAAAYSGLGIWSLVILYMGNPFLNAIGLWIISDWRPKFEFSIDSIKSMFRFGSWLMLNSVMRKAFDNFYIFVIGKFFTPTELGFYTKARQFRRMSSEQVTGAIGNVAFPVLSSIKDNKEKLRGGIRQFLINTSFFMVPLLIIFILLAKPFVIILLTDKWAQMIPYLQLLCIVGILFPIHTINVKTITALGYTKLNFKLSMLKNGLRVINFIVMYRFGILYIIIGEVILSFIALGINTFFTGKFIKYGLYKQIRDIRTIVIGGILMGGIGLLIINIFTNLYLHFIFGLLIPSSLYLFIQYFFNRKVFFEFIKIKDSLR